MSGPRQNLGRWGESLAASYLAHHGYRLVERNVRTPYGEIDLIMNRGELVVFVEVKTRRSKAFGNPEESVNARKQDHLRNSAAFYIQNHPQLQGEWRIDVVAIYCRKDQEPEVTHFENIING